MCNGARNGPGRSTAWSSVVVVDVGSSVGTPGEEVVDVQDLHPVLHLAVDDPGEVQQVVDETGFGLEAPVWLWTSGWRNRTR